MKTHVHLSRWLLIFLGLIVLWYLYKSIMAEFTKTITAATAPITGAENIVSNIGSGIKSGISTMYDDIKSIAGAIVGSPTTSSSDNLTSAALTPSIVPGVNVTPQDVATYSGISTANLPVQWDLTSMGITGGP